MPRSKSKRKSVLLHEKQVRRDAAKRQAHLGMYATSFSGADYDHAAAKEIDCQRGPGRIAASRTDPFEFARIATDPLRSVPRDLWHPDDVEHIDEAVATGGRVLRRDDGMFTIAID